MIIDFSSRDTALYNKLIKTDEDNRVILRCFSAYLNSAADYIKPCDIERIIRQCGVNEETAYRAALCAAFGIDDDRIIKKYINASVKMRNTEEYRNDSYYKNICLPRKELKDIRLGFGKYKAYEAFVCGDIVTLDDFTELPLIGFFTEEFTYPSIWQNGREWMTVKPNEIETMKTGINAAEKDAVVLGLGLGYYAYMISQKNNVNSVTVIERDESIIKLFEKYILPQFTYKEKIKIIQADALEYAEKSITAEKFVFADLWHDVSDGFDMYLRLRRAEERVKPEKKWEYWIEPSFISRLRFLVLGEILESEGKKLTDFGQIRKLLDEEYLRNLALRIKNR